MSERGPDATPKVDPEAEAERLEAERLEAERQVIETLKKVKTEGGEPSACEALQGFALKLRQRADAEQAHGPAARNRAQFWTETYLGYIYFQGGFLKEAWEAVHVLLNGMNSTNHTDLMQDAVNLLGEIEDRMNETGLPIPESSE